MEYVIIEIKDKTGNVYTATGDAIKVYKYFTCRIGLRLMLPMFLKKNNPNAKYVYMIINPQKIPSLVHVNAKAVVNMFILIASNNGLTVEAKPNNKMEPLAINGKNLNVKSVSHHFLKRLT